MPVYSYACRNCKKEWTEYRTIEDRYKPCEEPCPECGEKPVDKIISSFYNMESVKINTANKLPGFFKERMDRIAKQHPDMKWNLV